MNNRLSTIAISVMVIANLLTSAFVVVLQLDSARQRQVATAQREELRRQNETTICILEILPEDRTPAAIDKCRK